MKCTSLFRGHLRSHIYKKKHPILTLITKYNHLIERKSSCCRYNKQRKINKVKKELIEKLKKNYHQDNKLDEIVKAINDNAIINDIKELRRK